MIATLDNKRRLTVPSTLVPLRSGEHFLVDYDAEEDAIIFRRVAATEDWLDVLSECPVPMDDLPPRRREFFRSKL